LLTPCLATAADERLSIIPATTLENLTAAPLKTVSLEEAKTDNTSGGSSEDNVSEAQPTATVNQENTDSIPAGKVMIKEGLEYLIVDNLNKVFIGVGGLQLGEVNTTIDKDASQVAIFAVAAHTIDPTRDPAMMATVATMRNIYINAILIFGAILALFLIYQAIDPDESAKIIDGFTGNYTYVAPFDMAKYYITTCGWLLLGPSILYASLSINNYLVQGQMLSVLDQVAFSSDNLILYMVMGVLWLVSIAFFAVRLVMIILDVYIWIFYGLTFAFKKVRWVGVLITAYQIMFVFAQFAIIFVCCLVVSYATSQELAWYSVSFLYLGMFLVVVSMEFLFITWPVLWKLLSPSTFTTIIRLARYV
jgi:hypothetical protein